jgi:DNA mismatch repair protein MutS
MGKRLLKFRIMNPITDIKELNKRYNFIEEFINLDKKDKIFLDNIEKTLNEIIDIERMHRKLSLQILHPYEFLNLSYSYDNIDTLINIIKANFDITQYNLSNDILLQFYKFRDEYNIIFDLQEIGKYGLLNIGNSFFKKYNYKDIDSVQDEIDLINQTFNNECKYLSNLIELNSDFVKIDSNDRDGYFYVTTKKRSDILLSKLNVQDKKKYEIKKFNGANIKIVSSDIIELSNKLIELKEKIKLITKDEYLKTLLYFDEEYNLLFNNLSHFVALIDIIKCSVICAKKYRYSRPIINDINNGKSYFNVSEIRHPIIEMINDRIDYVKNDLELYHEKCNGILLYGVNGAGKSSLSKAVGCNIVLAQMGFYVASENFEYYPYKKIFTRINGDDNIFKGMSSFAVEMDELRSILKYSDDRSIVLGDEICKGTEETSALAIVSSSIIRFCKNNVNFIMATHFHKLLNIELISKINNIKFMHLTISYDNINGKIIYGRKLMDGPGSDLYGIEIASYIIEDDQFIENAKMIRNDLLNKTSEILVDKRSNYNNKLYMDQCSICGDNGTVYPLDTHHIKEQNTFDNDDIHKDKLSNLVVLCKKHHDEVHYGDLEIIGYKDTITGKELEYKYMNLLKNNDDISDITENSNSITSKKSKKKYNEEHIKTIMSIVDKSKGQIESIKYIRSELKKIDINIGRQTLTSIINGNY